MNRNSVKSICEFFWLKESEYNLIESNNLNYRWLPFRFKFYYYITEKTKLFEKAHPLEMNFLDKINFAQKAFFNFIWKTPLLHPKCKNLVVPLQRKINGVDIYSEELIKKLDSKMIIDSRMQNNLMKDAVSLDFYYVIFSVLAKMISLILRPFPLRNRTVSIVLSQFSHHYNLKNSSVKKIYRETRFKFIFLRRLYRFLLKVKGIENVYVVGGYFRMELIAAAKDLGLKVVELQHGTITKYHLGYSYPTAKSVAYFPDELWTFGEFWFDQTPIPRNVKNKIIGAPYINKLKSHKVSDDLKHNRVIINSQGVIGTKLFNFSLNVARLVPDLEVIFRLHPSEKNSKYQYLLDERGDRPINFQISHKYPNIFELMAFSRYVAGVFSTTLYEAMYLGAKIIIINDIGVEYMEKTIERGEAVVVNTPEEFAKMYQNAKISNANYYYHD